MLRLKKVVKQHKYLISITFVLANIWFWFFCLPNPLFTTPTSTVLFSEDGRLLGAKIAEDEQWRFPANDSVPKRFRQCIIQFEDAYFNQHLGVNPISLFRALKQNINAGKVISGGSTISMQTIRLAKANPPRTYWEKIIEMVQAFRLECTYSKKKILTLYSANAPFGGNVVGIDAASWRYFGKLTHQLSWAESATLAVLPNAPSLIYPGKNQHKLLKKRNKLLKKLHEQGLIKSDDYQLALLESLPQKPNPLPTVSTHLVANATLKHKGKRLGTSIDYNMQEEVKQIVKHHQKILSNKEIHNIAALVIDVETGKVKAYVGNTNHPNKEHNNSVDIIQAARSSGSILKPFLYSAMLAEGKLLPKMLLNDTPSDITENYNKQFDGAVAADIALAKSLNIPALNLLKEYGVEKFHDQLQSLGFTTITRTPKNYGLSLIVGGAEVCLWDLAKAYRNMAYQINHPKIKKFNQTISYLSNPSKTTPKSPHQAAASFLTAKAMQNVVRPESESGWQLFGNQRIAWKTGTSHGFKDAWAVGMNQTYVVAVWSGNADGEGRPGIIGVKSSAPILFDIFNRIRGNNFIQPNNGFVEVETCKQSGYLFGRNCEDKIKTLTPQMGINATTCPYHITVHLNQEKNKRVNSNCYDLNNATTQHYFVLPTVMAWYFKRKHPWYKDLPPYDEACIQSNEQNFDFIYPKNFTKIFLPKDFDGNTQPIVFEVAHRKASNQLFWYLDGEYLATTQNNHKLPLKPSIGEHDLLVTDTSGKQIKKRFRIVR